MSASPSVPTGAADSSIEHGIVYSQGGRYGGWPANHGIWIWGNEILVGFIEAQYGDAEGLHPFVRQTDRSQYARSLDGGITWTIEDAFAHGQTGIGSNHLVHKAQANKPARLTARMPSFTASGFALAFLRHNNTNGPSHYYYSSTKGRQWHGPLEFPNFETTGIANRTDYLVDGPQSLGVFLTTGKTNGKEGRVAYARTQDGGLNWEFVSWIGEEHEGFDIMPSSARLSPTELITVIRTRRKAQPIDLLTAYASADNGKTWNRLTDPVADTGKQGSPPALLKLADGRLALAYAFRSNHGSRLHLKFSTTSGKTWGDEITLRSNDGATRDVGYPRMVQRPDGKLVIVYYWNNARQPGANPYRYIARTIADPARWK